MANNDFLFTSESVSEGHPDKVADQISDSILDAIFTQDPNARVAAETLCNTGLVVLAGEITTTANVDYIQVARDTIRRIGYDNTEYGIDYKGCAVLVAYDKQSPDIAQGVDRSSEDYLNQGAGDQGLMFGYACDETPDLMPAPIWYSHRLVQRQSELRKDGRLPWLRPDAKSQVTFRYVNGRPVEVDTVVLSTQHAPEISQAAIREAVIEDIIKPSFPEGLITPQTKFLVNPTGRFVIGGPQGDCGLTGRKIIVDTYGGACPHGGGAFSGKDPSRSTARPPTRPATWPRTSWPPAWRASARCRSATPSAWPSPSTSPSTPKAPASSPTTRSPSWCASTSTCVRRASSTCWTCCARSTPRPPPTATSAVPSRNSRGKPRTRCRN